MPKATLFVPSLVALLLSCSALSGTAQAGWFSSDSKPAAPAAKTDDKAKAQPGTNLEDSIRQAQMLRLAGSYSEAINNLSQLMLVAADDPRVISEYGKTLAAMGRADEAEKFLTRAQELQPNDWTVYSALGVANDQIGNQKEAQVDYERALALKPGEPSVLSNYALSRMLAKDPAMASRLADRAEIANAAAHDGEIARNIAMIRSMAQPTANAFAVNTPAPSPIPQSGAQSAPTAAPHVAVAQAALAPPQHLQPVQHVQPVMPAPQAAPMSAPAPMASSAPPRQLVANTVIQAQPQAAQFANRAPQGGVMQAVPIDPLAGPVQLHPPAPPRAQRSVPPKAQAAAAPVKNEALKALAKAETPKPAADKPMSAADSLEARAEAIAKTLNKPGAIAQAQAEANRPAANKDTSAKPVALAKAATPAAAGAKVSVPVKAADVKPNAAQAAPKVLPAAGVKAADAKPAAGKTAAAKPASKDAIPGLRMSANAY